MEDGQKITYFAQTDARNKKVPFGIKADDRTRHMYVIGKSGMGKSTMLENLAAQDLKEGNGICFIDPHGGSADKLLEYVPEHRKDEVMYFAPFDMEHPIAFNILEDIGYDKRHLVVSGIMSTFKKIWQDAWSARMEYILGNTLLALLEYPGATLMSVNPMLSDKVFRKKVVDNTTDSEVKRFWIDEFGSYTDKFATEATAAIQNKIGQFTSNPLIRNIVGQPKSSFDFRELMDEKKIVLVNLSKGRIGESNGQLLGSLFITNIYLSAMSRADVGAEGLEKLPNFYLMVDEFQSFANESFADILSEARKYKLSLTMAHQYVEQMEEEVRAAVFGNVSTIISFRIGPFDAEILEKEFAPIFLAEDFVNLGFAQIYLRLMIDGIGSQPFSATTLPPLERPATNSVDEIIALSREKYAKPRKEVAEFIEQHTSSESRSQPDRGQQGGGQKGGGGNRGGGGGGSQGYNQNRKPNQGQNQSQNQKSNQGQSQNQNKNLNQGGQKDIDKKPAAPVPAVAAPAEQFSKPKEQDKLKENKPEATNPFKTAFKEAEFQGSLINLAHKEAVQENVPGAGLDNLEEKKPKTNKKVISPENKSELRAALAGIIGAEKIKEHEASKKPSEEQKPKPQTGSKKEAAPEQVMGGQAKSETSKPPISDELKSAIREVPADVLKDILESGIN